MKNNVTLIVVNTTIVLSIAACTIVGMLNGVDGWGYSYLLLLALMSSGKNDGVTK